MQILQVQVESFGLPALSAICGERLKLSIREGTLQGVLDALARAFGAQVTNILLDKGGMLDPEIVVVVNEREVIGRKDLMAYQLSEGDEVKFILMAGGG
jgi:sulfur carrier protein ThiS